MHIYMVVILTANCWLPFHVGLFNVLTYSSRPSNHTLGAVAVRSDK